jgi:UDP-N-acetylglucosamine/UDP-N-acetylgalactosamine diphosphorylase
MNSPATHEAQSSFITDNRLFGMPQEDVFIFCQGAMPAVDAETGKLLLAAKDELFLSPDGHGGMVAAMAACGAIDDMRSRGIEHLFYLQVDNPLVPICDAELIGHHLLAGSELTSIAVAKQSPLEKVGNFVSIDGRLQVIEYSDFPNDVAESRDEQGELLFWAGSIAVHIFSVDFLARTLSLKNALPFHVARKNVSYLSSTGEFVTPRAANALKFERFIFDLLPHARNALVVEYAEEEVFAPLKNAPGASRDTAEYVQRLMINQHRRWLESAGAQVAADAAVEISPLWALDAEAVAERIEPGMVIDEAIYLAEFRAGRLNFP